MQRSSDAPTSLAAEKSWRGDDVLDRLHANFLGKCYLCEVPVDPRGFEVDHRLQRAWSTGTGREYDWTNLYPTCEPCNKRRLKKEPIEPPLDPCEGTAVVERLTQQWDDQSGPLFGARTSGDRSAEATAQELRHLHLDGPKGVNLRNAIRAQILVVMRLERDLLQAQKSGAAEREHHLLLKLHEVLSRRAPFSALVRSAVLPEHRNLIDPHP